MLSFKTNRKKNVCLIGLMGSGKSVIGRELSKFYKIKFFDTDAEVEKKEGENINFIFSNYGEDYFRKIEEEICLKFLQYNNCIISLGGGSITNLKIRNMIKKNSYCIYLKVDKNLLSERLKNTNKRPLLRNKNKYVVINELYEKRKKFYNKADLIIENNYEKNEIVERILEQLKKI